MRDTTQSTVNLRGNGSGKERRKEKTSGLGRATVGTKGPRAARHRERRQINAKSKELTLTHIILGCAQLHKTMPNRKAGEAGGSERRKQGKNTTT